MFVYICYDIATCCVGLVSIPKKLLIFIGFRHALPKNVCWKKESRNLENHARVLRIIKVDQILWWKECIKMIALNGRVGAGGR